MCQFPSELLLCQATQYLTAGQFPSELLLCQAAQYLTMDQFPSQVNCYNVKLLDTWLWVSFQVSCYCVKLLNTWPCVSFRVKCYCTKLLNIWYDIILILNTSHLLTTYHLNCNTYTCFWFSDGVLEYYHVLTVCRKTFSEILESSYRHTLFMPIAPHLFTVFWPERNERCRKCYILFFSSKTSLFKGNVAVV